MLRRRNFVLAVLFVTILSAASIGQTDKEKKERADAIARVAEKQLKAETRAAREEILTKLPEARQIYRELKDTVGENAVIGMTGFAYRGLGEYQKAISTIVEALPLSQDPYERSTIYSILGDCYTQLREKEKAVEALRMAIEIADTIPYKKKKADFLTQLGDVHAGFGDIDTAMRSYDEAESLLTNMARAGDRADLINFVGVALMNAGRLPAAFKKFETAYNLMVELKNEVGRGLVINNRANAHVKANSVPEAIRDLEAAKKIFEDNESKNVVLPLTSLGVIYANMGDRDKALEYQTKAVEICKAPGLRLFEATVRSSMGVLLASLGEYRTALAEFKLVEEIRFDLGERQGEKILYTNIGLMHWFLGEIDKARKYYTAALRSPGNTSNAATYNNLGMIHFQAKEYQKVIEYSDLAIDEFNRYREPALIPTTLNNRALATYYLGDPPGAIELFDRAVVAYRAGNDRHGEAVALANLMGLWREIGKRDVAIFYGKMSVNQFQALRSSIRSFDGDAQQSFLGTIENIYRILIEMLVQADRVAEAEQVLRMLKDEEYFAFVGRDGTAIPSLDQRIPLDKRETAAAIRMSKVAAGNDGFGDRNISEIKAESLRRISLFDAEDKTPAGDESPVGGSLSAVRNWKDPDAVLVSTVVSPSSLIVIVTSARSRRAFTMRVSEEDLSKKVGKLRAAITERADTGPVSRELYDLLIAPIRAELKAKKAKTVVWSLDKFLRYLPIPALRDEKSGYLAEEFATVIMAHAGRQDMGSTPAGKAHWRVLGAGVSEATSDLEALEYVPSELCSIVREPSPECSGRKGVITGAKLLNKGFTFASFIKAAPDYQIAHIATHFKFISGTKAEGLGSFLLLGNGEKLTMDKVRKSNSLFAGIELLTLSACDTAYGSKTADGREIEGFGVLAQKQGAKSILATLWRVDDEKTRDMMVAFYTKFRKSGMSKAEALREAQLDLIGRRSKRKVDERFSHPYFWAPFLLIGNWR